MATGNGNSGGGQPDTFLMATAGEMHPRGILQAISYQETCFAHERGGCTINPDNFTSEMQWEFSMAGIKSNAMLAGSASFLLPLAVAALDNYLPVFGTTELTWFHKFSVVLLAMIFYVGYAFLIAGAASKYLGPYTYKMASSLVSGAAIGAFIKGFMLFIIFHLIYANLNDEILIKVITFFYSYGLSYEKALVIYTWLQGLSRIALNSAYFVAAATVLYIVIPYGAMLWAHYRNRKWIRAGIVEIYRDAR